VASVNYLREAAAHHSCVICGVEDSTIVLHHVRIGGNAGTGIKPPDHHGLEVCSACHTWAHLGERNSDYWKTLLAATHRQLDRWLKRGDLKLR
jgi:hypothetical protein